MVLCIVLAVALIAAGASTGTLAFAIAGIILVITVCLVAVVLRLTGKCDESDDDSNKEYLPMRTA